MIERDRRGWNVAILGATGAVGRQMVRTLDESSIEIANLRCLSTARGAGTKFRFRNTDVVVEETQSDSFEQVDLALFSAGAAASGEWAPIARERGAWVIDNSSRYRMDPEVALVVPEVNSESIPDQPSIIANPNCSTIQLVVALKPVLDLAGLAQVVVSTYQAVSGAGEKGVAALVSEHSSLDWEVAAGGSEADTRPADRSPFPHPIAGNVIPQCDLVLEDGYTKEEEKMLLESRKILGVSDLSMHPTCIRVPVHTSHSEAVYLETVRPTSLDSIRAALEAAPGLILLDDPRSGSYPTPLQASGTDPVWVGRLRADRVRENTFHFWVVADNLRKGAALNAVQIAEVIWSRRPV